METPQLPPPLPMGLESCCVGCQGIGPTKQVMFFQHIGAVILMFNKHIRGRLCRNCINEHFANTTLITSFLGWWGMISFFLTPIFLAHNFLRYLFCLPLQPPPNQQATGTGRAILALLVAGSALALLTTLIVAIVRS